MIERVDELRFRSQTEKHELSHLYEAKIKNMGNAGRNGGEYYTPRPLIRAMIQVVAPRIGERIYDGACGSAGFLCEAFDYLSQQPGLTTSDQNTLQRSTFYGKEKKSLAYVIAIMNMILHGTEAPNIVHANTLAENIADIQDQPAQRRRPGCFYCGAKDLCRHRAELVSGREHGQHRHV
ncbi:MAG: N-6 DNA methylase [Rhodoferax sp.]|uniref:HsdM family class I SAM-dependent methyltransferase n=1 Tax=Rhodoferax sp. TaxID=50421 RepID=UPI003BB7B959